MATHLMVVSHSSQPISISRILCPHQTTSATEKIFRQTFLATTPSIFDWRPHHQVPRDMIYPPGGTPHQLVIDTPPRADLLSGKLLLALARGHACGCVIHFPTMRFYLKIHRPPTRPPMPLFIPFDTCSCEFYAFLSSTLCSCCAISSH